MKNSIIKIENLVKYFGKEKVIDGLNLNIQKEEIVSIIGLSGAGKTTVLRMISGLEVPQNGKIYVNGLLATDGKKIIIPSYKRKIGFIFQNLGLWEHLSVIDHLLFVKNDREKAENVLKKFDLISHKDKKPYQLSGGQKQRLAIARVFMQDLDILLLDEPFSNLDLIRKKFLRKEILNIKKEKKLTIIYVTHDPVDVELLSDKVAVLYNGKIIQMGTYKELINNPASEIVLELLRI